MELKITAFFKNAAPMDYSASVAEIGKDAGPDTWRAAVEDSPDYLILDDDEKREAFRAHIKGFGAWDAEEIAAMSHIELNALLIQFIAGDIREAGLDTSAPDWVSYEADADAGRIHGSLFPGSDGEIYYSIEG